MTWLRIALPAAALIIILGLVAMLAVANGHNEALERANTDLGKQVGDLTNEVAKQQRRADALEKNAIERIDDDRAVAEMGKDLNDAIKDIPPSSAPSAATVALGCARLRKAGATTGADFKRICG